MPTLARQAYEVLKEAVADIEAFENRAMAADGDVPPTRTCVSDAEFDKFARRVITAFRILGRDPGTGPKRTSRSIGAAILEHKRGEATRRKARRLKKA